MLISIIIVNYNSSTDLVEAVESVEESSLPKGFTRKVILVENGSRDHEGEFKKLQELTKYKDVELLKSSKNLGFTGGNNLGIKRGQELNSDYFLLLNADTKVSKDFLTNLLTHCPADSLASPKIYFYPGFEFHKDRYTKKDEGHVIWYGGGIIDWNNIACSHKDVNKIDDISNFKFQISNWEQTAFATGCCLLISKAVIDKIGFLDDKYFFTWEDVDYNIRAQKAGFKTIYVPSSIIWHKNANTSGGAGGQIQDYYQTRNRLIFAFRYAKPKVKILLLIHLLRNANLNRFKAIASALISSFI